MSAILPVTQSVEKANVADHGPLRMPDLSPDWARSVTAKCSSAPDFVPRDAWRILTRLKERNAYDGRHCATRAWPACVTAPASASAPRNSQCDHAGRELSGKVGHGQVHLFVCRRRKDKEANRHYMKADQLQAQPYSRSTRNRVTFITPDRRSVAHAAARAPAWSALRAAVSSKTNSSRSSGRKSPGLSTGATTSPI